MSRLSQRSEVPPSRLRHRDRPLTATSQDSCGCRQGVATTLGLMNDRMATVTRPIVDIAIPVYNEEQDLERSVRTLHAYMGSRVPFSTRITIVDNASTDATGVIGLRLAQTIDHVRFMHLDAKGRGRALRAAWMASDAQVVAYMDVDLSTRIDAVVPLIIPTLSGRADITIGSRLTRGARVRRSRRREVLSRGYN